MYVDHNDSVLQRHASSVICRIPVCPTRFGNESWKPNARAREFHPNRRSLSSSVEQGNTFACQRKTRCEQGFVYITDNDIGISKATYLFEPGSCFLITRTIAKITCLEIGNNIIRSVHVLSTISFKSLIHYDIQISWALCI